MTKQRVDVSLSRRCLLQSTIGGVTISVLTGESAAQSETTQEPTLDTYDWSMYCGGPDFSGHTSLSGISEYDREDLSISGSEKATAPAIKDGTVYAGADNQLIATNLSSGQGEWIYQAESNFIASPAVGPDTVAAVTEEGTVVVIDRTDGDERWALGLEGRPGFPTISDGTVYVGDTEANLYAFNTETGNLTWNLSLESNIEQDLAGRPGIAVGSDRLYASITQTNANPSRIIGISFDGTIEWKYEIDGDFITPPAVSNHGLCISTSESLRLISRVGGVEQWTQELRREAYRPPAVGEGYIAVVDTATLGEPKCNLYDITTGEEKWTYTVSDGTATGGATIAGDHVYFTVVTGGRDARIFALGLEKGLERFSFDTGNSSLDFGPIPVPNGLFIPASAGSQLLVTNEFRDDTDRGSTSSNDDSTTTGSDTGTETANDEPNGSESTSVSDTNSASAESTSNNNYLENPLSTIESIVVIISGLLGGLASMFKKLQDSND